MCSHLGDPLCPLPPGGRETLLSLLWLQEPRCGTQRLHPGMWECSSGRTCFQLCFMAKSLPNVHSLDNTALATSRREPCTSLTLCLGSEC